MTRETLDDESERLGRERVVSRRDALRKAGAGLTATVGLAVVSTPVAAEQGAIYDLFENDGDGGSFARYWAATKAGFSRTFADDSIRTAEEAAAETTDVFNTNASTLVSYANDQLSTNRDKTSIDTIRIKWQKDVTVERWIVAGVDTEKNTFTSVEMVGTEPDRDVDHWVRLEKLAAAESPDELEHFVNNYAEDGEPVDAELEGRLAGRYGPDVESSLL